MKGFLLDHFGITHIDPTALANRLIELGLCTMDKNELPKECTLEFVNGAVLQLHKGDNATGVKPAIGIDNPLGFQMHLAAYGIKSKQRRPEDPYVLDFEVCGLRFHTVKVLPVQDFNKTHPELGLDEEFLTNIGCDENLGDEYPNEPFWHSLQSKYQTIRLGRQAYTTTGEKTGGFPIFVSAAEIQAKLIEKTRETTK